MKTLLAIILAIASLNAIAQTGSTSSKQCDTILLCDGDSLLCMITDLNLKGYTYTLCGQSKEGFIKKDLISTIQFSDGRVLTFECDTPIHIPQIKLTENTFGIPIPTYSRYWSTRTLSPRRGLERMNWAKLSFSIAPGIGNGLATGSFSTLRQWGGRNALELGVGIGFLAAWGQDENPGSFEISPPNGIYPVPAACLFYKRTSEYNKKNRASVWRFGFAFPDGVYVSYGIQRRKE